VTEKSVTFHGTLAEVQQKAADWIAANPDTQITQEGAPFAAGEKAWMIDESVWSRTIYYKTSNSN
jgi:hypothetical protein